MPNIQVSYGTTYTNQAPGSSFDVNVDYGGSIYTMVNSPALLLAGFNNVRVAGSVSGVAAGAIQVTGDFVDIWVDATGTVSTGGSYAIEATTGAFSVTNNGFIGVTALHLSALLGGALEDEVFNAGIIQGNVDLKGGDDTFIANGGEVRGYVDGGAGNDLFQIRAINPSSAMLRLDGGANYDTLDLRWFGGAVWIDLDYNGAEVWTRDDQNLSSGNWRILADVTGFEALVGSANSDYLSGDANSNTFIWSSGLDTIAGDGGVDLLDFTQMPRALWIDLDYVGYEAWSIQNGVWVAIGEISGIENVTGTFYADTMIGDNGHNVFAPLGGNDIVSGEGGNDRMVYDPTHGYGGNDSFNGGVGADSIDFTNAWPAWVDLTVSGVNAWVLDGATWRNAVSLTAVEDIIGSSFEDYLKGDAGNNWIQGGAGNDTLVYTGGFDWFYGGADTDTATFASLAFGVWVALDYAGNEVWRNNVNTQLADLLDVENVTGTAFDDYLQGNAIVNTLVGGGGADILIGGFGPDTLTGGTGADTFRYAALIEASNPIIPLGGGLFAPSAYDAISDFQAGSDKIDIRAIDASGTAGHQPFVWANTGLAGTVNYGVVAGTSVVGLLFYVDGNAGPDFVIYSLNTINQADVLLV